MALVRLRPPSEPTTIEVDGHSIQASAGEPIAMSIGASGRLLLSRSVKYHRPRGAVCYGNRCDGCLMRVDGTQSVATCVTRVAGGEKCETQNVLGSAQADVLSVTDWFYPHGLDHHHMFTKFGTINRIMQKVARRIAGVGALPTHVLASTDVQEESFDVLVVGVCDASLRVVHALADERLSVLMIDERQRCPKNLSPTVTAMREAGVGIRFGCSALGVYEQTVLVFDGAACGVLASEALVFATGTHAVLPAVEGVDHPGVISEHAAFRLLEEGFAPGEHIALVCRNAGDGTALQARWAESNVAFRVLSLAEVAGISGGNVVERVRLRGGEVAEVDAVVFAGFHSAVYELAAQAGAACAFVDDGFWVQTDESGCAAPGIYALGSCTLRARPTRPESDGEDVGLVVSHLVGFIRAQRARRRSERVE